jgi:NAD(P)-dependent dehydrogenase (short-subunit alcohol dehydrogenase family)
MAKTALLDGKVAVITGAGGALGRAYALLLAGEGASIVVNDYSAEAAAKTVDEIVAAGGKAVAVACDVGSVENGEKICQAALDAFGGVHILVNNAGILRDKALHNMDEGLWDAVLNVHLKGTFAVTKPIFSWMRANKQGGVIVNTTSTAALFGNFGQTNYGAAKGGIWTFTKTLAVEGQRFGIRAWSIAPAAVSALTGVVGMDEQTQADLKPEYVAPAVLYMVSGLSGDKTGKCLFVGGQKIMELKLEAGGGIRGAGLSAQQIADNEARIFRDSAELTFADLS